MKTLWFDTETTGLNPDVNDIIQIAGIIEIDGVVKDKFEYKCRPFNIDNVDQKALDVHGFTLDQIKEWPDPKDVYKKLISIFGKYIDKFDKSNKFLPAGHNNSFDVQMLAAFFRKCNDNYFGSWFTWQPLDTMQMLIIARYQGKLKDLKNNKLETAAKYFNIYIKAHNALSDIQATRELSRVLLNLIK